MQIKDPHKHTQPTQKSGAVRCKGWDNIILNSSINSAAFIENKNSGVMHCMSGSFLAKLQPFEGLA